MAKDTENKLRNLIMMKDAIIKAFQKSEIRYNRRIDELVSRCNMLVRRIHELRMDNRRLRDELEKQKQEWWMQQDADNEWIQQQLDRMSKADLSGTVEIDEQLCRYGNICGPQYEDLCSRCEEEITKAEEET